MTPTCTTLLALLLGAWPTPQANPVEVPLPVAFNEDDTRGSLVAANLVGDERPEILVTAPGHIVAVDPLAAPGERVLWDRAIDIVLNSNSENNGLPGHHGHGVSAADLKGDGREVLVFLTFGGELHVADGATGETLTKARPPVPAGAERWEVVVPCALRGDQARDVILQATNKDGYRMGRYLAAYALDDLDAGPLWERDDYVGCAHNSLRVADLDGDGRDEVLGATLLGPDGELLYRLPDYRGHLDSIYAADIVPDRPGLEVLGLQEGGQQSVFLFDERGLIWRKDHKNQEPQNAALGEFDLERPGLELWCRSRYNEDQRPWVFDAEGNVYGEYVMNEIKPEGWTVRGVEVINSIHWDGSGRQLGCAKERHRSGNVALFEPVGGRFVQVFEAEADRLYVADVLGDWREEILVLQGDRLRIFWNDAANPNPERPRLWQRPEYQRAKRSWNYYSP